MIKFKKMSTFAKVGAVGIIAAVTGVAFIPVINQFIDNPKSKVHVYKFNGRLFKSKSAAEDARKKFTAMSGLVKVMKEDETLDPNIDYKPLMAEFISFVSKLFTIKIFQMDDDSSKVNHFKYDGLSDEQKQDLLEQEINGQIKYGDLKDVTSLVKFASAHKEGNEWMFTPAEEMLLSVLGDGSGQGYSLKELEFVDFNKKIEKLKDKYEEYYRDYIIDKSTGKPSDNIAGLPYNLVHGLTHYNDETLVSADREFDENVNEGDGSGDSYSKEFIEKYQQWGTLKVALENSKKDLDDFVTEKNIKDDMRPILLKLVADNAIAGWNNKERYSDEELELRDLLAKVASQTKQISSLSIPGDHTDTNINIVAGWNWKPTGDASDKEYKDWQLQLAKDIQNREKLLNMHIVEAPENAIKGMNTAPTGDGSGLSYDQSVFDLKADFQATSSKIDTLTTLINQLVNANTKAAPKDGVISPSGLHTDAIGLGDGKDHSQSWEIYNEYKQLQQQLKDAQEAQKTLQAQIAASSVNTQKDSMGGQESELNLMAVLDFDVIKQGWNWNKNYNVEEVQYAKDLDTQADLQQKIKTLMDDGVTPAPDGATTTNKAARGDETGTVYAQEQIDLRDYQKQLKAVGATLSEATKERIQRAPKNAMLNPDDPDQHSPMVGLGNNEYYSSEFIAAARSYRTYLAALESVQKQITKIEDKYKDASGKLVDPNGVSFEDIHNNQATEGKNTGELFSKAEVQYTKDDALLTSLTAALSTANAAVINYGVKVSSAKNKAQLEKDLKDGKTPEPGLNVKPSGDKTGNHYSDIDIEYRDALKTIKNTFKDGNPWWTKTSDKKSDVAYFALYNDWKNAIANGAGTDNSPKQGDGTDNHYDEDQFVTFDTFFRQTIKDLHSSDSAVSKKVSDDFDTVLNFLKDNGKFELDNGFVRYDDKDFSKQGAPIKSGDGSGHKYLDLRWYYFAWKRAYVSANGGDSYKTQLDKEKAKYKALEVDIKDGSKAAAAQKLIDEANVKIDDYKVQLKTLTDKAAASLQVYKDAGAVFDTLRHKIEDEIKDLGYGIKDDDKVKALAALDLKDNMAGTLSDDLKKKLIELKDIEDKLPDAQKEMKDKNKIVNELQDKSDFYHKYTKLNLNAIPVFAKNWAGNGDKSGKTYTQDQITARNLTTELKNEIKKHHISGSGVDDELVRLKTMKNNSVCGLNGTKSSGNQAGDTSGTTWKDWEIELKATIFSLKGVSGGGFAPEGAEFGINHKPTGDATGNDYTSDSFKGENEEEFIKNYIPSLTKALKEQAEQKKVVDDLVKRKTAIDKLNINNAFSNEEYDKNKYFVTKTGSHYTLEKISKAKLIVAEMIERDAKGAIKKAKEDLKKADAKAVTDYVSKNKNDLSNWNGVVKDQEKITKKYSSEGLVEEQKQVDKFQKAFDNDNDKLITWQKANASKNLDTASSHRNFDGLKVATKFEDFIDGTKTNSINNLFHTLITAGAHTDGGMNTAGTGHHTEAEQKLRDALVDLIPMTGFRDSPDISDRVYIFNNLIVMYGNAIKNNEFTPLVSLWGDGKDFSPTVSSRKILVDHPKTGEEKEFKGKLYSDPSINDHSSRAIPQFKKWIFDNLMGDTEKVNSKYRGDGSGKTYKSAFLSNSKGVIDSVDKLQAKDFALGQAAFRVSTSHGSVKRTDSHSVIGENSAGTGDKTGNTYTYEDIDYFNAIKSAKEADKKVTDMTKKVQDDLPSDGTFLLHAPTDYKGEGADRHTAPVGDGTGNTYLEETIEDVRTYYAKKSQLQDKQKLIDDLEKEWDAKSLTDKRTWAEVMTIGEVATAGLNHQEWWTAAEIKYDGDNILNTQLLSKIDGLLKGTIADPNYAGSGTPPQIKVTEAPDNAVVGLNNPPEGLQNGQIYTAKQVAERDRLSQLNKDLVKVQTEINDFKRRGVIPAPDSTIVGVKMEDWHPEVVGDGSNKYYSDQIFEDKAKIDAAKLAVKLTQAALDEFINGDQQKGPDSMPSNGQKNPDANPGIGQAALDEIIKEVGIGMVDGINQEVRYSLQEIALRDDRVKLGEAKDHLTQIHGDSRWGTFILLKDNSIPGLNVIGEGLKNGIEYSKDQIKLRDISKTIRDEELRNGISSEEDIVSYVDLFSQKTISSGMNVRRYYSLIDTSKAVVGFNHAAHGDQSDAHYTDTEISTFNDIVALQISKADNEDRINELKAKGISNIPPSTEIAVDHTDTDKFPSRVTTDERMKLWGTHVKAAGNKSGDWYEEDLINNAKKLDELTNAYKDAKDALDNFENADSNLISFFKLKIAGDKAWNPIEGRNWTKNQFELKKNIDDRDALKVGRTMIDSNEDRESVLGTNRGYLGDDNSDKDNLVMYEVQKDKDGKDIKKTIKDELVGSDKVRIGFVLKQNGEVTDDSPVLDSLEAVAQYVQMHEELAPDNLVNKFAFLQGMGIQDTSDIYKIKEEIVSKDWFNTMVSNYEWGDE